MIMIISLFSFLFLKHRVYSNCDVKSSRSSHVFRRHVSWLSWNPHLNSRSVVIVWSREGFLISLIQLFPSPRLQGHSIFNALPFHSPLSTLHSPLSFPLPLFFPGEYLDSLTESTSSTMRTLLSLSTWKLFSLVDYVGSAAWYRSDPEIL